MPRLNAAEADNHPKHFPLDESSATKALSSSLSSTSVHSYVEKNRRMRRSTQPRKLDTTSPPAWENTQVPNSDEFHRSHSSALPRASYYAATCPGSAPSHRGIPPPRNEAAAGGNSSLTDYSKHMVDKKTRGGRLTSSPCGSRTGITGSDWEARKDLLRKMRLCLLKKEGELKDARCRVQMRDKELAAAGEEITRLRRVVSSQQRCIDKLNCLIGHPPVSSQETQASLTTTTSSAAGLDGVSVKDIKDAVRGAAAALVQMEKMHKTERQRNRILRRENDLLRRQLALLSEGQCGNANVRQTSASR
ncbi:unnamed protein product [Trypanosoma congolense IL3000]|uniref:WGS project CAEQ00000000 data, annotated contig 862 n=1 Tax=Trypanosoma congolense (strain IL3000) TaxID=1068625 RepID=F9WJ23_TRYCI|nr:unnamed protein product [Trypanosoma congolense IL3000]